MNPKQAYVGECHELSGLARFRQSDRDNAVRPHLLPRLCGTGHRAVTRIALTMRTLKFKFRSSAAGNASRSGSVPMERYDWQLLRPPPMRAAADSPAVRKSPRSGKCLCGQWHGNEIATLAAQFKHQVRRVKQRLSLSIRTSTS